MSFENKGSMPAPVLVTVEPDRSGNLYCNGTADEVEINLAFTYLTAARTWKERVVLIGDFTVDAAIEVPSYTVLDIRQASITLGNDINEAIITNSEYVAGNTEIEIIGGILDGNYAQQTTEGWCIDLRNVTDSLIKDVHTLDAYRHNIAVGSGSRACNGITIEGGIHENPGDDCIAIHNSEDIRISNVECKDATGRLPAVGGSGIEIEGQGGVPCTDVTITNVISHDNDVGIYIGEHDTRNVTVSGGALYDNSQRSIYIMGTAGHLVTNIVVTGVTLGGGTGLTARITIEYAADCQIGDFAIDKEEGGGPAVEIENCVRVQVSDGTIYAPQYAVCVDITDSTLCTVENLTLFETNNPRSRYPAHLKHTA